MVCRSAQVSYSLYDNLLPQVTRTVWSKVNDDRRNFSTLQKRFGDPPAGHREGKRPL